MSDSKNTKKKNANKLNLIPKPNTSRPVKIKEKKDTNITNKATQSIKDNKNKINENDTNKSEDIQFNAVVNFEEDKNFQQIKEELNKASNFIDYFLIIGVEPSIFKNDWLYKDGFEELNKKEELKPKIISYFPPFEKTTIAFDDSIIMHCFPNGYNLVKSETKPNYKIFSFILDNNYFNVNYPQKYLTCLIFYEGIAQYKELYFTNHKLEEQLKIKNFKRKLSEIMNSDNKDDIAEIYIPKCLMIMSLYPFFSEFERILLQLYNYSTKKIQLNKDKKKSNNDLEKDNNTLKEGNSELTLMRKSMRDDISEIVKTGSILSAKRSRSNIKREDKTNNDNTPLTHRHFRKSIKNLYNKVKEKISNTPVKQNITEKNNTIQRKTHFFEIEKDTFDCYLLIDKFIENFLIELPVPPRGETKIIYNLMNEERKLIQSKMNQLPLIDVNLKNLFVKFKTEEIIDIYHYLFLEIRVLFFSKDIDILNIFIYGLLSLLYPFEYQYQIVTILPKENFEIIESITPFIAGINEEYKEDFFESKNLSLSDCILIVDLDSCKLNLINTDDNKIPEFPKNYKKQLEKNLNNILNLEKYKNILEEKEKRKNSAKNYKKRISVDYAKINSGNLNRFNSKNFNDPNNNNENAPKILMQNNIVNEEDVEVVLNELSSFSNFNIDYQFNYEINTIFFNFNASLLANYSKFLDLSFYSSNVPPSLEVLFKVKDFLKEIPSLDKDFYDRFINETQLFGDFLYKRMIPKNSQEKIRVLLFDETINENNKTIFSKSHHGVFIKNQEYDFVNMYEIQKPREITKDEYNFFMKTKNQYNLLSYGIIIDQDKENNNIIFNYPVFPKLLTNILFLKNIQEYYTNTGLSENIELINRDIISKSHLGGVAEKQNDMNNYIDLCWLQMWAMTFWYCDDEKEKKFRFRQLINVLNKTSSHEMEIINLLFDTLEKNGEEYMVLKLYDILIKLRLNPSFKVHNIVMKYLDKYKSAENININDILQKAIKHIGNNFESKDKFTKRTFKSKYYKNILSEDIIFYAFDTCIYCQQIINLQMKSKHFEEMNREIMWVQCPNCKEYCLTKIWIQFGKEINKNGKMKYNTCKYDSVVLFSPYSLKMNYKTLLKDFGIKLDVDELMFKYSNIFWNSLWYFKLNDLEYDFMLPYEKEFDEEIFNDNIEVITNEVYKRSLEKKNSKQKKDAVEIKINKNRKKDIISNGFDIDLLKIERIKPIYP